MNLLTKEGRKETRIVRRIPKVNIRGGGGGGGGSGSLTRRGCVRGMPRGERGGHLATATEGLLIDDYACDAGRYHSSLFGSVSR
jgi:hypothetical protein